MDVRPLFKLLRQEYGLSNNDCVLYYEIYCLFFYGGKYSCYASNEYFETELGISSGTVKRSLNTLRQKGLIKTRTEKVNKCILVRNIYPLEDEILIKEADKIKQQREKLFNSNEDQKDLQEDHEVDHFDPHQVDHFVSQQVVQNDPTIIDIYNTRSNNLKDIVPEDHSVPANKTPRLDYQAVKDKWNAIAKRYHLQSINTVTTQRATALKARFYDIGGEDAFWSTVENAIKNSPFLRGQNNRKWRASFDWVITQSRFVKLAEGVYSSGGSLLDDPQKPIQDAADKDWIDDFFTFGQEAK